MGITYVHAVASLDGYIADEHDNVGALHDCILTATIPSSTRTPTMFTARHSGPQRPRLSMCAACGCA